MLEQKRFKKVTFLPKPDEWSLVITIKPKEIEIRGEEGKGLL